MVNTRFSTQIRTELVKLLYKQVPYALWAESVAALTVFILLYPVSNHDLIFGWLFMNLIFSGLGRHILVYCFHRASRNKSLTKSQLDFWLILFTFGAFISGLSWGMAGSLLMVKNDMVRQSFIVILLLGVTASANPFFSAYHWIYIAFLLPAFLPFGAWLTYQGGPFILLGFLSLVYIGIMYATSIYTQNLLTKSLQLRFENIDLVGNLSETMTTLEKRSLELETSLSTLRTTLESTTDGILAINQEGATVAYNQKFLDMWNIPPSMVNEKHADKRMINIVSTQLIDPQGFVTKIEELYANPDAESFDEIQFQDGRIFERYSNPQRLGEKCIGRVWSFRDVTGKKLLENKLYKQANYDVLTDLPNRALVMDRLTQAITYSKRFKTMLVVMFLDLDRFKLINDTLGHAIGDKLLKAIAERLRTCIRENDTLSREGGDEFLAIINSLKDEEDIIHVANKCLESMSTPFYLDGNKIISAVSIGISLYPKDGQNAELLIRNADIAMYRSKELGGNNFQFFTAEMNRNVQRRSLIENELRNAIDKNEFFILYQPIVDLKTGKITKVEALLRWQNAKLGLIMPSEFIPIAEECGLIIPIGEWTMFTACKQVRRWQNVGFQELGVSINISLRQLRQEAFFDDVNRILQQTAFNPKKLSLEITESTVMEEVEKNIEVLNKLKAIGICIAIDDFGTGYSSLNYLKQLPVDKLKIDKTFIDDIPHHSDDAAITSAIIAISEQLNLKVIAEGVVNEEQLNFLRHLECDEVQGYYFSPPIPANECEALLQENLREKISES